VLTQIESRVEHAAQRQYENASERAVRGGLLATARRMEPSRCRSSLDVVARTQTAAPPIAYRVGDAFSGMRNSALDLRQHNCLSPRLNSTPALPYTDDS
jgi:hypothetical protein